jgi:hypothetical protein
VSTTRFGSGRTVQLDSGQDLSGGTTSSAPTQSVSLQKKPRDMSWLY